MFRAPSLLHRSSHPGLVAGGSMLILLTALLIGADRAEAQQPARFSQQQSKLLEINDETRSCLQAAKTSPDLRSCMKSERHTIQSQRPKQKAQG
jgi:hypothetical protein